MDLFTHYVLPYAVGKHLGGDRLALRALTLAALAPDFDGFSIVFGAETFDAVHGTLSHSLLILPLIGAAIGLVVYLRWRRNVFAWAIGGAFAHFLLDLPNLLPTPVQPTVLNVRRPFLPLSDWPLTFNPGPEAVPVVWTLAVGSLFLAAVVLGVRDAIRKEPVWRVWVDERALWRRLFPPKRST